MRLAGDISRNGVAIADALGMGKLQYPSIVAGERNHGGHHGPGETDAGDIAGAVHWVGHSERSLVKPFGPALGIVVNADRGARPAQVDMMRKRTISESEFSADLGDGVSELLFALELWNIPRKRNYTVEHP